MGSREKITVTTVTRLQWLRLAKKSVTVLRGYRLQVRFLAKVSEKCRLQIPRGCFGGLGREVLVRLKLW